MKLKLILFSIIFIILSSSCFAQGKIISKADADNQFGKVIFSQIISQQALIQYLDSSKNILMFNLINGQILIANDSRKLLTQSSRILPSQQVMHVFSKTILQELLNKGSSGQIVIEQRANVLSITYDSFTLEFSGICPPTCP